MLQNSGLHSYNAQWKQDETPTSIFSINIVSAKATALLERSFDGLIIVQNLNLSKMRQEVADNGG